MNRLTHRFAAYTVSALLVLTVLWFVHPGDGSQATLHLTEFYLIGSAIGLFFGELCLAHLIGFELVFGEMDNPGPWFFMVFFFGWLVWPARIFILLYRAHKAGF